MRVNGSCHCGAIQYEAEIDIHAAMICHCTDCQTLSSTAFRVNAPASAEDFKLTKGTPKEYVKIGESGRPRAQGFCSNCGTQIYATSAEGDRSIFMLRVGAMKERSLVIPKIQSWNQSALKWIRNLQTIPTQEKG
jgi:hypothetical protein